MTMHSQRQCIEVLVQSPLTSLSFPPPAVSYAMRLPGRHAGTSTASYRKLMLCAWYAAARSADLVHIMDSLPESNTLCSTRALNKTVTHMVDHVGTPKQGFKRLP